MRITRSCNCLFLICFVLFINFIALSCTSAVSLVNSDSEGFAIKGFDPVAYFTMGKPVEGVNQFSYDWSGAKWRFSSKKHLDLFSSDPDKYAPQYGGY